MYSLTDEEEARRLQALYRCDIIDTAPEAAFDALASFAASVCDAPIALIGFVDDRREWFKSRVGVELTELPIEQSLDTPLLSRPPADAPTASRSLMLGGISVRFYAHAPVRSPDGYTVGAIAVADSGPRALSPQQQASLSAIAAQVGALLELRTLRQPAAEGRRQALLAELGRRALAGEPIASLLDWATRRLAQVLEVDICQIIELLPGGQARPSASSGWVAQHAPSSAVAPDYEALAAAALRAGRPIVLDAAEGGRADWHEALRAQGIVSGAIVIIPGGPRPYGFLSAYCARPRGFAHVELASLQSAADLIAELIAQRWHQQTHDAIVAISRTLRRATTRREMMTLIFSHIHAACQSVGAAIVLRNADGRASVAQGHGIWAGATGAPIAYGSSISWQVMQSRQPFLGHSPDFPPTISSQQASTDVCVALEFSDQPIGALWVAYPAAISYYDQRLLIALADVVSSAINRSTLHDQTIRLYQEHQQLTRDVRRAERYLASIVESASDLMVSTDADGRIITWNRAAERASGLAREQVAGRHLRDLCPPAHQTIMRERIASLMAGGSAGQIELSLIGASREDVPISWRLSALQSDAGENIGVVAVGRDLAEQRRLEAQLFQAAKMASMGVMASGIGHELRNPLSIISANAQLAQELGPGHEMVPTCLQQIHAATTRAALIIDNLLTFARPRGAGSRLVDVNEVLAATLTLLDYQIHQHHIDLITALARPLPEIVGNAALLQQVFTNVILNAVQAMEGGGTLRVTTRISEESGVEAIFSDTGGGIAPEVLPHIFDPFFTTRTIGQGTGLGLAISYSIIQQHGGSIEAVSPPGSGSTFCVRLPAAPGL